jgi:hypothetical protein
MCEDTATKIKQLKQFIAFHTFHRTPYGRDRENNIRALEKLELFDPTAQEQYLASTCKNPHTIEILTW